jgi:hypothetical protein
MLGRVRGIRFASIPVFAVLTFYLGSKLDRRKSVVQKKLDDVEDEFLDTELELRALREKQQLLDQRRGVLLTRRLRLR